MKYLVTGAAGFLGSNLVPRLLAEGHRVDGFDNLSSGCLENLRSFVNHENFDFTVGDVTTMEPSYWYRGYNRIINLAALASPPFYQKKPLETTLSCVLGTYKLCQIAGLNNARFLQASTSEVYGDPTVHPQKEEYFGNVNSYGPRSCYDEGKRCAESIIYDFQHQYKLDSRIIRIFNTYGPGMAPDDGRVVSNFIVQALRGEAITIYGTGSQSRSFCYVDDLINGMLLALEGAYSKPINVGNPKEFTIKELAYHIGNTIGWTKNKQSSVNIVFKDLPIDDPMQRSPDISKMKEFYGWEPKIQLEEGLTKTIKYFAEKIGVKLHD